MKLSDCEKEIKERQYLLGTELEHISGTHEIEIDSLEPMEVMETGLYYIQCHYNKQNEAGVYGDVLLANKLGNKLPSIFLTNAYLFLSSISFLIFALK